MEGSTKRKSLEKSRQRIGATIRSLREARTWTQTELSKKIGISQGRLSDVERGRASITAEQLLLILKLFNASVSDFAGDQPDDPWASLQNALARLGARHLHEREDVLPDPRHDDLYHVVLASFASLLPRLITALAPVIVLHIDAINLRRLELTFTEVMLERRLGWLVDNIVEAIGQQRDATRPWTVRYRRATVVLQEFQRALLAYAPKEQDVFNSDILDAGIRSTQTLQQVKEASSSISRKWRIITALVPDDFATALKAARD